MARFSVWGVVRNAAEDLRLNKGFATQTYAVFVVFGLAVGGLLTLVLIPKAGCAWPSVTAVDLFWFIWCIGLIGNLGISMWMWVRWAGLVMNRVTGAPAPPRRFWPTLRAFLKIVAILIPVWLALVLIGGFSFFGANFNITARVAGGILALGGIPAAVWISIRLAMVVPRALIGEGTSVVAGWQATRGCFWQLFGLWILRCFALITAYVAFILVSVILVTLAAHFGGIAPPTTSNLLDLLRWYRGYDRFTNKQLVSMAAIVITAPLIAAIFFIITGACSRVALALRPNPSTPNPAGDPWAG